MYATILSGQVFAENRSRIEKAYAEGFRHPPEGMLHSFLIHSADQPNLWEIVTIWKSREAYEQARAEGKTDICTQMFCDAGSTPERTSFEVIEKYERV